MKLLIVEDQEGPLEALEKTVKSVGLKYGLESYDVARCYNQAKKLIDAETYRVILLDHCMPYEDQTELEKTDFMAFCDTITKVGYGLIPLIKSKDPTTVVIGTSSLSSHELRRYNAPDYHLDKLSRHRDEDLERILHDAGLIEGSA